MKLLKNSKGKVYYGMHFYPGVAEYQDKDGPYRVFLNENTLRSMDPSFAGRPIFVDHVDDVNSNVDEVRKEADGWVIESFFNRADGKHWVKFIVVSELGERAIRNRMRLSNAYTPKSFAEGGLWNGVEYAKEITSGEFEHLAIVDNPRYEESVILTPEEFKKYNEDNFVELTRLANSKTEKEQGKMAFKLFKRTKVENSTAELEGSHVILPKSGREISIEKLVNEMDEYEEKKKSNEVMAEMGHKVKLHDGSMCNVSELLEKHKAMHDELKAMKEGDEHGDKDDPKENEEGEDEEAKKKALGLAEHEEKEIEEAKKKNDLESAKKKKEAKEKADKLRNAGPKLVENEGTVVEFSEDQVARGKSRYGSK